MAFPELLTFICKVYRPSLLAIAFGDNLSEDQNGKGGGCACHHRDIQ